jgi:NADH-quinone oxidoreductase subunit N
MSSAWVSALPLFLLAAGATAGMLAIAIRRSHRLAVATAGLTLVAALLSLPLPMRAPADAFPGLFLFDAATLGYAGVLLLGALAVLAIAAGYFTADAGVPREEYPLLLVIATLGGVALVASANVMTLFLGVEIMGLAMIGMIAYPRRRLEAEEAGFKYLVLSGMSSAIGLFGLGLIVLATGRFALADILARPPAAPLDAALAAIGLALTGVAAGFKLSVVPFHVWVADIYAGAPAPSAAYVAVLPKIAMLGLLARLIAMAGSPLRPELLTAFTLIAALSMIAGNLLALLQENLKRLLGYSSIAHVGYALLALLAAGRFGPIALVFYLVMYTLTVIGAFGVIAALSPSSGARDLDQLDEWRGLFWRRPWLASIMTVMLFSLAGIPPAIGFIAKMYAMAAGVQAHLTLLTGTLIVSSVIGLFYYLRVIMVMAFRPDTQPTPVAAPRSSAIAALIGALVLALGTLPGPLTGWLETIFGR